MRANIIKKIHCRTMLGVYCSFPSFSCVPSSVSSCCSPAGKCQTVHVSSSKRGFSCNLNPFQPLTEIRGVVFMLCSLPFSFPSFPPLLLLLPSYSGLPFSPESQTEEGGQEPKEGALHHGYGQKPRAPTAAAPSHSSRFSMRNEADCSPHPFPAHVHKNLYLHHHHQLKPTVFRHLPKIHQPLLYAKC